MRLTITYYLEVVSSWCFWAEPLWAELKHRYPERVNFEWKIAMMDATEFPTSREQLEWFYRRSGSLMRAPFMLNSGWYEPGVTEYLAPNLITEAGREFGVTDDTIRLALANAALRDGKNVGQWDVAAAIAAAAAGLDPATLQQRAHSAEIELRVRSSTTEFRALQVTQRPTFVLASDIGDRAVFSGIAVVPPIAATIDAMLADIEAYESHTAHFGHPPELSPSL